MSEVFALVPRAPGREQLLAAVPGAHNDKQIEQSLGAAFARLARGEAPLSGAIPAAIEARSENILRMTDPLFSRMFISALRVNHMATLPEDHLTSAAPECLASVRMEHDSLKRQLDSDDFVEEAEEAAEKIKGPEVNAEYFITYARIGLEQIGEVARLAAFTRRIGLSAGGSGSADFEFGMSRFAQDVKTLGVDSDYKFEPPRPETNDIEEQTKLLSVMAYVAVQRYAETGRSDLLASFFRSCQTLVEKHSVSPESLNLPQAIEGAMQIQGLSSAVVAQAMGHPAYMLPFSQIRPDSEHFRKQLAEALRLMQP